MVQIWGKQTPAGKAKVVNTKKEMKKMNAAQADSNAKSLSVKVNAIVYCLTKIHCKSTTISRHIFQCQK